MTTNNPMAGRYTIKKSPQDGTWQVFNDENDVVATESSRTAAREAVTRLKQPVKSVLTVDGDMTPAEPAPRTMAVWVDPAATLEVSNEAEVLPAAESEDPVLDLPAEPTAQPVAPAQPVVASTVATPVVKKVTKAEVVRGQIKLAKQNDESQEVVIKFAVDAFGFSRALARSYVLNNWDKVIVAPKAIDFTGLKTEEPVEAEAEALPA